MTVPHLPRADHVAAVACDIPGAVALGQHALYGLLDRLGLVFEAKRVA